MTSMSLIGYSFSVSLFVSMPAFALELSEILKDSSGNVLHLVHSSDYMKAIGLPLNEGENGAKEACENIGQRLPNVHELVLHSISLGAKGIKATAAELIDVPVGDPKVELEIERLHDEGYYPIERLNKSGQRVVDYYFNHDGYQRPDGDTSYEIGEEIDAIWSSSVLSKELSDFAYIWSRDNGGIEPIYRGYGGLVVSCVDGGRKVSATSFLGSAGFSVSERLR